MLLKSAGLLMWKRHVQELHINKHTKRARKQTNARAHARDTYAHMADMHKQAHAIHAYATNINTEIRNDTGESKMKKSHIIK